MTEDEILSEAERLLADGSAQGADRVLSQAWPNRTDAPADALHLWASIRFTQGNQAEAETMMRDAVSTAPSALRHHIALGHLLSGMGNHDEAAQCYANALNIDSNWPGLLAVYAISSYRSGRYADAERGARIGLERAPSLSLWDTLSCALRAQEKYADALDAAQQGLKVEPSSSALQHSRAAALLRLERFQEALDGFDALVARGEVAAALSLHRGQALAGLNRTKEAANVWAEGLARWPMSVGLQRAYVSASRN